ncbi:hypothetical protein FDP41_005093 [Naegleria fowleri]|uniref:Branched-chain-amino-acid aminotransferase n=1 Tax=Naegleria fowleri TaxID=5763 RepID=A0A6A5BLK4_NAEFO|nr:uncharacterized protein FDP41_005093 [Naegleria fowleri]KAF0975766.1 hypothetical protein FDP41_005093 [Naegleria fowleri]
MLKSSLLASSSSSLMKLNRSNGGSPSMMMVGSALSSTSSSSGHHYRFYHQTVATEELKDDHTSIRKCPYGDFYHTALTIEHTKTPLVKPPWEGLVFGKQFTDHMLEVDWNAEKGWTAPRIVPYHDLVLPPSCSALHYAIQCFEGLKAYKNGENVYLFRPEMNANRMNRSCARLGLPNFAGEEFLKCLAELVKVEKDWVPDKRGYSLYLRPTVISTERTMGVLPPNNAKLFVICSPVGPYFKSGFAPVKLLADPKYVRAFPGGTGNAKVGSNYGPTIMPQLEAIEKGYSQVLWLFGSDHQITEVGTMNIFFYRIGKDGEKELITPPLGDVILPGVTRDSVLHLVRNDFKLKASEVTYTMSDFIDDVKNGRLLESFGAGTACVVAPISAIRYEDTEYPVPVPPKEESLAMKLWDRILSIQYGETPHPFCHNIENIIAGTETWN